MIELAIAVVIIVVIYLVWYRESLRGTFLPPDYAPRTSSGDVKYLGTTTTKDQCAKECTQRGWCGGHTWYEGSAPNYGLDCYGVRNPGEVRQQQGAISGRTSTLARLFSDNAGNRDEFRANTTFGTMDQYRENYYTTHTNGPVENYRAPNVVGTFDQYRENYYSVHNTPNGPVESYTNNASIGTFDDYVEN